MTTKERLDLMEDIKRKNDAAWSKYAHQPCQRWTWEMDERRKPFDNTGFAITLTVCFPVLLVLFVILV